MDENESEVAGLVIRCPNCGEERDICYTGTQVSYDDPPDYYHVWYCDYCDTIFYVES